MCSAFQTATSAASSAVKQSRFARLSALQFSCHPNRPQLRRNPDRGSRLISTPASPTKLCRFCDLTGLFAIFRFGIDFTLAKGRRFAKNERTTISLPGSTWNHQSFGQPLDSRFGRLASHLVESVCQDKHFTNKSLASLLFFSFFLRILYQVFVASLSFLPPASAASTFSFPFWKSYNYSRCTTVLCGK
jgi:hypothetical protein